MSSSDKIKDALQTAFPATSPKDWKRRSKTKEGDRTRRDFEHPDHGMVSTFEAKDGSITIDGLDAKDIGGISAAVASGDTDAAKALVDKLVEKQRAAQAKKAVDNTPAPQSPADAIRAFAELPVGTPDAELMRAARDIAVAVQPTRPPSDLVQNIKAGDKIEIAKGVPVFTGYFGQYGADDVGEAKRATTATVTAVMTDPQNWITYLPQEDQDRVTAVIENAGCRSGDIKYILGWTDDDQRRAYGWGSGMDKYRTLAIKESLRVAKERYHELYGEHPMFVVWGSGATAKATFVGNVKIAADKETTDESKVELPDVVENPDTIKAGDRVRIPAGTPIWTYAEQDGGWLVSTTEENWYWARTDKEAQETDIEKTVIDIVGAKNFISRVPVEQAKKLARLYTRLDIEAGGNGHFQHQKPDLDNERTARGIIGSILRVIGDKWKAKNPYWARFDVPEMHAAIEEARIETAKIWGDDPQFVMWGNHPRLVARIEDVVKVADKSQFKLAAAPKKAEKAITKRRLMVEGSKWRFTRDCTIEREIDNPEINHLCRLRDSFDDARANQQTRQGGTIIVHVGSGRNTSSAARAKMDEVQKQIDKAPRTVKANPVTISAGTEFVVTGKLSAENRAFHDRTKGLGVPVEVTRGSLPDTLQGWRRSYNLPYNQIEDAVEALEVPETIVWVLRDMETGDYFGGWKSETDTAYGGQRQTDEPKMSSTFSGAKKYKTKPAAMASVRDFTGYNAGLDDEGGAAEWVGIGYSNKKMDLPETWELVAIDKTTNTEKERFDLQGWYQGLMRLRVLTAGHGSAVRGAYKKAEGQEGIESIIVFTSMDGDNPIPFEDGGEDLPKKIDAAVKNFEKKPIRVKTAASIAFACAFDDAVLAKMSFADPRVKVKILNSTTLEEMVENQKVSA